MPPYVSNCTPKIKRGWLHESSDNYLDLLRLTGSRLALRHGSGFVRLVFLAVTGTLIIRFALDTFA